MTIITRKNRSLSGSYTETRREIIQEVGWQVRARPGIWCPLTDLYESGRNYVVAVEIAGMQMEGFDITVEDKTLIIRGSRPEIPERRAFHLMEIRFGKFESIVTLPGHVNIDSATAEYSEGFLKIVLPITQPNKINIEEKD